jgi:hypothetical protein
MMRLDGSPKSYKKARYKGEWRSLFFLLFWIFGVAPLALATEFLDEGEGMSWTALLLGFLSIAGLISGSLFLIRLIQRQFLGNSLRVDRGRFGNLKNYSAAI